MKEHQERLQKDCDEALRQLSMVYMVTNTHGIYDEMHNVHTAQVSSIVHNVLTVTATSSKSCWTSLTTTNLTKTMHSLTCYSWWHDMLICLSLWA